MTFKTGGDHFDTGMSVGEAIARAEAWWDKTGRHAVNKTMNEDKRVKVVPSSGNAPALIFRDTETVIPSGILNSKPWDDLTRDEKRKVVKVWHHNFVRLPAKGSGEAPPPDHGIAQVLTVVCDGDTHPRRVEKEAVFRGPNQKNVFQQAVEAGWLIASQRDLCPVCVEQLSKVAGHA